MSQRLLVPVDGSAQSERAFEHALGVPDAEVTVITVIDPFDIDPLSPGYQSPLGRAGMPGYSQEWYEAEWENVEAFHDTLREQAADAGIEIATEIEMGAPGRKILQYADDHDIDGIVIGATSEHGLSRVLMGSTAESVTKRAPVTVTVVRG